MNLNQITIPSTNVEKAVEFYTILGLKLIVDSIPRYVRFECPDGDATFSIHRVEKLPKGNGITVYFEDENLDDWVEQLMTKGIIFTELPNDKPWLWREAHLKDPDDNNIILFYAGENRKNPAWRIPSEV
ncbi:VOC family protein [Algibacter lectus]|uniref:Glyoxalase/dioxygenase superfamily protein n=2 Tax=Algibacter TaxID=261827 RepID=A0A090V9P6_9FLAO|nr:VOC family protein [Algibacter lectus]MWW24811.1 VOC family protein [Algibacter lectus]TDY64778.1 putative enzyme related to lactoylglutathione lyase [Algibacter lectus]GAL61501.1 glyoxalase/dioxygenase superfamily protein [Algibacter lectus]